MRYRDRENGQILTAQMVRDRASGRGLPGPSVKPKAKDQPEYMTTVQVVLLSANEENWDQFAFDAAHVDPIIEGDIPAHNPVSQVIVDTLHKIEGDWHMAYWVEERFSTVEELRKVLVLQVQTIGQAISDAGIEVNGARIRTDAVGVSRITLSKLGAKITRKFVESDKVYTMTKNQVDQIFVAVDNHVQACYDRRAALIEEINASDLPLDIDLMVGWP